MFPGLRRPCYGRGAGPAGTLAHNNASQTTENRVDNLTLARWQFGITTVYHFIFVPLTIGMSLLVATLQTIWNKTGNVRWLKLTKFFGKLLLINFAIGIATGIVQEFQFGMNWSEYSRFVGDIFGAPLAMEALIAFFIESTFLGVWIFGWDKLSKKAHLTAAWLFAIASNLSAFIIIQANSFMQHPVGAEFNPETGRAEMTNLLTVVLNPVGLAAFYHVFFVGLITAATMITGVSVWWMVKLVKAGDTAKATDIYRPGVQFGAWVMLISGIMIIVSGDIQGKLLVEHQPMKMAAAEGIADTEAAAPFTVAAFGTGIDDMTRIGEIPGLFSFLATNDFNAEVQGVNDLQAEYTELFADQIDTGRIEADQNYSPDVMVSFWSFRMMFYLAAFAALLAVWALVATAGGKVSGSRALQVLAVWAMPATFAASLSGWIFTEMGRQPWIVHPVVTAEGVDQVWMLTQKGVSLDTVVPAWEVLTSMILFTLIYLSLAVIWFRLMKRYSDGGVADDIHDPSDAAQDDSGRPMSFAY
jgi:cytochrome bd ubiquinol oxidase subunit I